LIVRAPECLKQDLEREFEGKLPSLSPSFCDFATAKKVMTTCLPLPSCFFVCCSEEVDGSFSSTFYFGFVATKRRLSLSVLVLLQQRKQRQICCHSLPFVLVLL
jgi:hypothetical protein